MALNPYSIKIIDTGDGNKLFFHSETLQMYPLPDSELTPFLEFYRDNGREETERFYGRETFDTLYSYVCSRIESAPESFENGPVEIGRTQIKAVILPVAAQCNLKCPYCFAQTEKGFGFKSYSQQDAVRVLDYLFSTVKDKTEPLTLVFFGGEPLLEFDIIEFTVKYIKENYSDYTVGYSITTNGTALNDKIISFLSENKFAVMVSSDGFDNEYNLRRYRNGRKSVHKVTDNIKRLKEKGIDVSVRITLVSTNPFICETCDFFEKLEVPFNLVFAYQSENKSHSYAEYGRQSLDSIKAQLDSCLFIIRTSARAENPYTTRFSPNRSGRSNTGSNPALRAVPA